MADYKTNAVNEALKLPLIEEMNKKLDSLIDDDKDFVIAMVDADSFMRVNDTFGHGEGDRVLIEIGRHLVRNTQGTADIYRYGGDQFAVVFDTSIDKETAFLNLEEIRKSFDIKLPDDTKVSISMGIAAYSDDASTGPELVRKAEGAMTRAKINGKNRVNLARDDKMVTKTTHYTVEQLQRLTKVAKRECIGEAMLLREALDALLKKYDA